VETYKPKSEMLEGKWGDMVWPNSEAAEHWPQTGLEEKQLVEIATASVSLPDTFVRGFSHLARVCRDSAK
jgi:hypothetical protein